jgi:hypothetical protein
LDHVSARVTVGAQMIGNRKTAGAGGVHQGVFEQDGGGAADQLAERSGRIAKAEGERVGAACCGLRDGWRDW